MGIVLEMRAAGLARVPLGLQHSQRADHR
jgi:hypothetical protein